MLTLACRMGWTRHAAALLAAKADVNLADDSGETPLLASVRTRHATVANLLLKANANPNQSGTDTPLTAAAALGASQTVELLLRHRAEVHMPRADGMLPLLCASLGGQEQTVEQLLKRGAQFSRVKPVGGKRALLLAAEMHCLVTFERLLAAKVDAELCLLPAIGAFVVDLLKSDSLSAEAEASLLAAGFRLREPLELGRGQPTVLAESLVVASREVSPPTREMPFLRCLTFAAACQLEYLPPAWIAQAPALELLDVRGNCLRTLPTEATRIALVNFEGNPDIDIQGLADWKRFLEDRRLAARRQQSFKLIVVGQEGAGKTTLISSLAKGGPVDVTKNQATDGVAETVISLAASAVVTPPRRKLPERLTSRLSSGPNTPPPPSEEEVLSFQCYDFAGQEIYYPSHEIFMSRLSIFLLACNATELLKNPSTARARAVYWLHKIKTFVRESRAPVFLVYSHWDRLTSDEQRQSREAFTRNSFLQEVQLDIIGPWYFSAKTGFGVQEMLAGLRRVAQDTKRFPMIPDYYVQFESMLRGLPSDHLGRLFPSQVASIGFTKDRTANAVNYLEATGSIIHFEGTQERPAARCYFVKPIVLADLFKDIISLRHRYVREGHLQLADLEAHIWKGRHLAEHTRGELVALLEQFELVYRTANSKTLLVPSLFPEAMPPAFNQCWPPALPVGSQQVGRVVSLPFVPKGFFPKLLLRLHHLAEVLSAWRHGILLQRGQNLVAVRHQPGQLELWTRTRESSGILLFTQALNVVDGVFESYSLSTESTLMQSQVRFLRSDSATEFSCTLADCVEALRSGKNALDKAPLHWLVPELCLSQIPRLQSNQLELGAVLGVGAFACVYAARYGDEQVAVKVAKAAHTAANLREVSREIDLMSRLRHPSLVGLYGVAILHQSGLPAVVLELCPLGSLPSAFHLVGPELKAELAALDALVKRAGLLAELRELDPLAADFAQRRLQLSAGDEVLGALLDLADWEPAVLLEEQERLGSVIDELRPRLQHQMMESDAGLTLSLRLRAMLDLVMGLSYLHSFSPAFVHNDVRSPNVFLLQLQTSHLQVAKLGDFGLVRMDTGGLKMGLGAWRWLAPEVLDDRKASTFTTSADVCHL